MNLTEFTDEQKQALLDLLVLGMYADGNLDLIEDEMARGILDSIDFSSETMRQRFIDDSFTRARQHNATLEAARIYIGEIAKHFPASAIRREVYSALEDSLSSDGNITDRERELLIVVGKEFGL